MTSWTTTTHWPDDLLRAGDLTGAALQELLQLAARMKADPGAWTDTLAGEAVGCYFERPSTRAGLSVEIAAHRLGMHPVTTPPSELLDAEPLDDTARVLSGWARAIVVRDVPEETMTALARAAGAPVINALSDGDHPCQAVADLFTLRERFASLEGLVLTYVGVASNISRSLAQAGALAGMHVRLACPRDHAPAPEDIVAAQMLADLHSGSVTVVEDPREAATGADALYTAPWPRPVDEAERRLLRQQLGPYRVTPELLAKAKGTAVFLHCLPADRELEVAEAVIDGRRSVVWQQAANRVPAEQAAIYALVRSS
jgi:ornithine carbamoyltransferase